jgi:alpha-amylase
VSHGRLAFCFGIHNHQPVGNFDHVLVEATERAYHPFLERLDARPALRLTVHCSGNLLEWLRERSPRTFDLLAALAGRGQVELLTGGFFEPILAVLPDHDKLGQIERMSAFLKTYFGVRPRGMWLAERVWEPQLPRVLAEAGVEYVLLDDSHFELAGLDAEALGGYYLTEDQGVMLRVFPISQRMRYLIPFADADASVDYLAARRGRVAALTMVDDGEKFGVWPGTHAHVYDKGWLDRFFDRLLATDWLDLTTLGDVVDRFPATGRVYLPAASYREMGEWALPADAGRRLETAKHELAALPDGARLADLLRGGVWRGFLVKYPEVADTYWKMLRLSRAIQRARAAAPQDTRLADAETALWRGQANDAYWHGVFGGCYLPHLRRAVKGALLDAERRLADAEGGPPAVWSRQDGNGDGREEVYVRTRDLAVTLNPDLGGALTELGVFGKGLDLADILARRPEAYHAAVRAEGERDVSGASVRTIHDAPAPKEAGLAALLAYDDFRRGSLLEAWFGAGGRPEDALDPVSPWRAAGRVLAGERLGCAVRGVEGGVSVTFTAKPGAPGPAGVEKVVTVRGATVGVSYRLSAKGGGPVTGRWAVQWNLALTAGDAQGRYLTLPGRPSLGSAGRAGACSAVSLVDEWIGLEARLQWTPAAELAWGPVQTVSVSEGGYERIYQGTALLLTWPVALGSDDAGELSAELTMAFL